MHGEIDQLAAFVEAHFNADKLNIATIGNIVPQLHIHVIGRFHNDFCWPAPVWGQSERADYTPQRLEQIHQALLDSNILQHNITD